MSICTATGTGTGEKGCQKNVKAKRHILSWSSEQEIDITSLENQPAMQALITASSNRMSVLKNANYVEPVSPEQTVHTPQFGSEEIISETSAKLTMKHKTGNVMRRTLAAKNGDIEYILVASDMKTITGERSGYDKLKTVKATVNVTDEVIDEREYKVVTYTFSDVNWNEVKKDIAIDYKVTDLVINTGLYIYAAGTSTSVTATITDAEDDFVTGLTVGNFSMYNITQKAAVTIGTVVDNADGTYTIPITSGASATDVIEVRYSGPGDGDPYEQIETEQLELLT